MILTGPEIKKRMQQGTIVIEPFRESALNPNSYNLHLHPELLVYREFPLDMKKDNPVDSLRIGSEGFLLEPGKLYLGRTEERTVTQNLVPMLEGRSSCGRLGLFVHITAGFGDTGFDGFWTLEIQCIQPLRIYAGVPIAQIFYHEVVGEIIPYRSNKYQKNQGVQSSRMWMDFGN